MGGLHRLRSQRSGEPESANNLVREECAQRRGNYLRCKVAAIKPKAQPRLRQDSQRDKDGLARPQPKGDGGRWQFRIKAITVRCLMRVR